MNRFKDVLIVTDLDGTLLNSTKNIGAETRNAIEYFISEGGNFTFATGRLVASFESLRNKLLWNAPVIFANGSQIYDYKTQELLFECNIPNSKRQYLQNVLSTFPGTCMEVYRHLHCDMLNVNDISIRHSKGFGFGYTEQNDIYSVDGDIAKVLFTNSNEILEKIRGKIEAEVPELKVRFSNDVFLEVFSAETDKGKGVLKLAEILGVDRKDIYTAGDQENDLDLLASAQTAFAPENAVDSVKISADVVLPDNDHNTIAALIAYISKLYPVGGGK